MDAVVQPVGGGRLLAQRVQLRLQRHEDEAIFFGDAFRALGAHAGLGIEHAPVILRGGPFEHEGLQNEDLHARAHGEHLFNNVAVGPVKLGVVHAVASAQLVPDVVDADQDAQVIGREVYKVAPDAGVDVHDPVAADAPVQKAELPRIFIPQITRHHGGIAVSAVIVVVSASVGVRNGIALKYESLHIYSS